MSAVPEAGTATALRPQYTCLVRVPFPRGDFVDPAPVNWDATKDAALWKLISKAANSKDLDWAELSNEFQVSLPFLLQQAAWLYERHFAQMRAQMKKLDTSNTSPTPPQEGVGSVPPYPAQQQRPGSRQSRAPSAMSTHSRDSLQPVVTSIMSSSRAGGAPLSRTPSNRTVTQSRLGMPPSPREAQPARSFRPSFGTHRRPPVLENIHAEDSPSPPAASTASSLASSEDDSAAHPSAAKSQVFRRPLDLRTGAGGADGDFEAEDDESSGGFLPFASKDESASPLSHDSSHFARLNDREVDPTATLRVLHGGKSTAHAPLLRAEVASSTSSAESTPHVGRAPLASSQSSAVVPLQRGAIASGARSGRMARTQSTPGQGFTKMPGPNPATDGRTVGQPGPGALSPRHRAELGRLSGPTSKDGSDGTPSMGSSFSDLDDASVTQSALEDALLSNMQHGNIASRMSNFSQALRSKYLPQ